MKEISQMSWMPNSTFLLIKRNLSIKINNFYSIISSIEISVTINSSQNTLILALKYNSCSIWIKQPIKIDPNSARINLIAKIEKKPLQIMVDQLKKQTAKLKALVRRPQNLSEELLLLRVQRIRIKKYTSWSEDFDIFYIL